MLEDRRSGTQKAVAESVKYLNVSTTQQPNSSTELKEDPLLQKFVSLEREQQALQKPIVKSDNLEYDPQRPFRDQPADKIQFNSENYNDKGPQITPDLINAQYTVETLVMAVLAGAIFALLVGFITGYFCGRRCHKDEDDNLPYPDTEYEYFEQRQNVNRIQAEPKLLPQVEEVTYAEPVLLPQPSSQNKMQHSPKNTLRKPMGHHHGVNSETLFQFQPDNYNNARDNYRGRDNFGTLRSHQVR
uniref:Semaphorin-1A n=1 Tax=Anopheles culicifacies TaxID=139723 RepID=A0A182MR13_9DIPT